MGRTLPCQRPSGLVVRQLPDELLVYDTKSNRALCLNRTAALVFSLCDGKTTEARMAEVLRETLHVEASEAVVSMALDQLANARLLDNKNSRPKGHALPRRQLLRKLGLAAAALPAVFALLAPSALSAASYTLTVSCPSLAQPCPGFKCLPYPGSGMVKFCTPKSGGCQCQ